MPLSAMQSPVATKSVKWCPAVPSRGSGEGGSCTTDSGSQVHKSQINQKAAGRTRELQRAVAASALLLSLAPIQSPIRYDSSRAEPS